MDVTRISKGALKNQVQHFWEKMLHLVIEPALQGLTSEAIAAYERALAINSGRLEARKKLVKLLEQIDPERAMREASMLDYVSSFYGGP